MRPRPHASQRAPRRPMSICSGRRSAVPGAAARRAAAAHARHAAGRHHLGRRLAGRAPAARPGPGRRGGRDFVGHAPRRLRQARPGRRRPADAAAVRRQRLAHHPAGRRALHRPHHPRRAQRAVRLRPSRQRQAGGAGGPRRARAAGAGRLRRRPRRAAGVAVAGAGARRRAGQFSFQVGRRTAELHALQAKPATQQATANWSTCCRWKACRATIVTHILDTAASFVSVSDREVKKVPLLRGKSVFNLFFENSTRTRTTFEIAATRLSADVINLDIARSSASKGESLLDTIANLSAMAADLFVVRHSESGRALPDRAARGAARARDQRRRRPPCAPDAGAAGHVHDPALQEGLLQPHGGDRRRRAALARRALGHPCAHHAGLRRGPRGRARRRWCRPTWRRWACGCATRWKRASAAATWSSCCACRTSA